MKHNHDHSASEGDDDNDDSDVDSSPLTLKRSRSASVLSAKDQHNKKVKATIESEMASAIKFLSASIRNLHRDYVCEALEILQVDDRMMTLQNEDYYMALNIVGDERRAKIFVLIKDNNWRMRWLEREIAADRKKEKQTV